MVKKTKNMEAVSKLFEGWEETLIWSCLQDVMGSIFVTEEEEPTCAMAQVGDFCFFCRNSQCRTCKLLARGKKHSLCNYGSTE